MAGVRVRKQLPTASSGDVEATHASAVSTFHTNGEPRGELRQKKNGLAWVSFNSSVYAIYKNSSF
jgi:hypothetical protein